MRPLQLHPGVAFALHRFCVRPHATTVASVLDRIGLSHRSFAQIFHDQVGLTPKSFSRVQRFQRVLRQVHRLPSIDWADVALECGYYDQAHFIHDFQTFSGFTPTVYAARATEHLNHVPLRLICGAGQIFTIHLPTCAQQSSKNIQEAPDGKSNSRWISQRAALSLFQERRRRDRTSMRKPSAQPNG